MMLARGRSEVAMIRRGQKAFLHAARSLAPCDESPASLYLMPLETRAAAEQPVRVIAAGPTFRLDCTTDPPSAEEQIQQHSDHHHNQ